MSSDSSRARRGQIDRLITLLAQDVNSHVSGRGFAPKLIQTAVNVVSKDVATSQDKIERVSANCNVLLHMLHTLLMLHMTCRTLPMPSKCLRKQQMAHSLSSTCCTCLKRGKPPSIRQTTSHSNPVVQSHCTNLQVLAERLMLRTS